MTREVDYALVGGGLQNGLVALALAAHRPGATVALFERGAAVGGNHTWCFHAGDVGAGAAAWVEPLVAHRWPGYDVAFPDLRRTIAQPYACVTSARLAARVAEALARPGCELRTGAAVLTAGPDAVLVRDGEGRVEEVRARVVIDARGPERAEVGGRCAWQKFLGRELRLAAPHGLERPMLMDATVEQRDGMRFCYVLPLDARRVLVEDTYFSDGTYLDVAALRAEVDAYAAARGWIVDEVVREETGLLPLPSRCAPPRASAPLVAGYAGGWFHPVTGYSFPIAARLAEAVAAGGDAVENLARDHASQLGFALRLNRMFRWFEPAARYRVLERFYRLPEATIARFYALQLTTADRARILVGRPPRGLSLRAAWRYA
ncbi:MAG: lycopene beta-cyclase CrtY [Deltaproteobacteria bacterium]|nr:lycopene beta-cyclase CrtY [Deltaproteobacteria bacterium]